MTELMPGATGVLALANGDPLVVEQPVHRGRVVLVGTSADPSWTWEPMAREIEPSLLAALAASGSSVDPKLLELVIANIALAKGFIDVPVFSILVLMALLTTILTPFLLKEGFRLIDRQSGGNLNTYT